MAAKSGGDPDMNPRLRTAILAAKAENMPADNIKRAIQRGTGELPGLTYEEFTLEGYGPGGCALIVEALTDNRNRTASELRTAFSKQGGTLGETNSVSFMFDRVGEIIYPADKATPDAMLEAVIEAGGENVDSDADQHTITTSVTDFGAVRDAMETQFGEPASAKLTWNPKSLTPVTGDAAQQLTKLLDILEDNDDVQNVLGNYDLESA